MRYDAVYDVFALFLADALFYLVAPVQDAARFLADLIRVSPNDRHATAVFFDAST